MEISVILKAFYFGCVFGKWGVGVLAGETQAYLGAATPLLGEVRSDVSRPSHSTYT